MNRWIDQKQPIPSTTICCNIDSASSSNIVLRYNAVCRSHSHSWGARVEFLFAFTLLLLRRSLESTRRFEGEERKNETDGGKKAVSMHHICSNRCARMSKRKKHMPTRETPISWRSSPGRPQTTSDWSALQIQIDRLSGRNGAHSRADSLFEGNMPCH